MMFYNNGKAHDLLGFFDVVPSRVLVVYGAVYNYVRLGLVARVIFRLSMFFRYRWQRPPGKTLTWIIFMGNSRKPMALALISRALRFWSSP